jgi:hypothetical protein
VGGSGKEFFRLAGAAFAVALGEGAGWAAADGGDGGPALLQRGEVVEVVAGHDLDERPEGLFAALGVGDGLGAVGGGERADEGDVPLAQRLEAADGLGERVGGVDGGPGVLIKGLEDGVGFAVGLAQAPAPGDLAVGEVGDDLAEVPLAGGG